MFHKLLLLDDALEAFVQTCGLPRLECTGRDPGWITLTVHQLGERRRLEALRGTSKFMKVLNACIAVLWFGEGVVGVGCSLPEKHVWLV